MNIESMTDEDKIAAIRKACGWGDASRNPLEDLNAMHEAEKTLTDVTYSYYITQLEDIVEAEHAERYHTRFSQSATASQRADAFLKTICPT